MRDNRRFIFPKSSISIIRNLSPQIRKISIYYTTPILGIVSLRTPFIIRDQSDFRVWNFTYRNRLNIVTYCDHIKFLREN